MTEETTSTPGDIFKIDLPIEDLYIRDIRNRLSGFFDAALWLRPVQRFEYYSHFKEEFGLEIVEEMDPNRPQYRCVQYVFDTLKHEEGIREDPEFSADFLKNAPEYLEKMGYKPVESHDKPKIGDVIGYGIVQRAAGSDHINQFLHFGVLVGENIVESKFNDGPVVRHKIDQVPRNFNGLTCNEAVFFRKAAEPIPLIS